MPPLGDQPDDPADSSRDGDRLDALERNVAALRRELSELRAWRRTPAERPVALPLRSPTGEEPVAPSPAAPSPSFAERVGTASSISGAEIELLVGRYGTLALAAAVILSAVGAVIKMAVERGLITPEVRVFSGLLVATIVGGAGLYFRRRGETRYGGVLLALALAIMNLVAWAAGPLFHLVPTGVALVLVDLVALVLAVLALQDDSEFLFVVAVAGALSAPFVTAEPGGRAVVLLLYGGGVLAGAMRAAREPKWMGAFGVLVAGAFVYALAAASLPIRESWHGPFLIALFGGVCAVFALVLGQPQWRGSLPRAYLAVAAVGVLAGWDRISAQPFGVAIGVAVTLAVVTYAALLERDAPTPYWRTSAVLLPLVSLGVASAVSHGSASQSAVLALWTLFALLAWRMERFAGAVKRGGAHLLTAGLLGGWAVTVALWDNPLGLVAGLAAWGIVVALLVREEEMPLPIAGVALSIGAAALSAMDQLVSRAAYSYMPFASRSSASALCAALGIGVAGLVLARGRGVAKDSADRPLRLGLLIGFLILWGRMELAHAFSADMASFLLSSYYAACGVGSIIAGRQWGMGKLRVAGLGLALFAAFKALVEVTDIQSLLLRVSAYAAVGVFLLGAGWLYRAREAR